MFSLFNGENDHTFVLVTNYILPFKRAVYLHGPKVVYGMIRHSTQTLSLPSPLGVYCYSNNIVIASRYYIENIPNQLGAKQRVT